MVNPIDHNLGLSLEEAREKYEEVKKEFERVRSCYSGLVSRFRKNMKGEDIKSLTDCFGVLLPLGGEDSVQGEVEKARSVEDRTLHYQIGTLSAEIRAYLAGFKNSGFYTIPK